MVLVCVVVCLLFWFSLSMYTIHGELSFSPRRGRRDNGRLSNAYTTTKSIRKSNFLLHSFFYMHHNNIVNL
jgi:hypothetical protein